jgi:hypothetical protein
MVSAIVARKQGPRNHRAGNLDFRLPPADFLVCSGKQLSRAGCPSSRCRLGLTKGSD